MPNIRTGVGTKGIMLAQIFKLCSDVHTGVGTPHRINEEKTSMVGVGWGWSGEII